MVSLRSGVMDDGGGVWKSQGGGVGALEERNARRSEPSLMHSLALTLIFGELAGLPE